MKKTHISAALALALSVSVLNAAGGGVNESGLEQGQYEKFQKYEKLLSELTEIYEKKKTKDFLTHLPIQKNKK